MTYLESSKMKEIAHKIRNLFPSLLALHAAAMAGHTSTVGVLLKVNAKFQSYTSFSFLVTDCPAKVVPIGNCT